MCLLHQNVCLSPTVSVLPYLAFLILSFSNYTVSLFLFLPVLFFLFEFAPPLLIFLSAFVLPVPTALLLLFLPVQILIFPAESVAGFQALAAASQFEYEDRR